MHTTAVHTAGCVNSLKMPVLFGHISSLLFIASWSEGAADLHSRRAYRMHHTMLQSILYVHIANRCTFVCLSGSVKQVVVIAASCCLQLSAVNELS